MSKTKIEWAEESWNPITGCTKISDGCRNCYAEKMAIRMKGRWGYDKKEPFKVTLHPDKLARPAAKKKGKRIFVCSMGDIFHKDVPDIWIKKVFAEMYENRHHVFMILTKRAKRMREFYENNIELCGSNIWFGVSAENQKTADERIPELLAMGTWRRFISAEPLLENIDISLFLSKKLQGETQWLGIKWVICGGESGSKARPLHPDWVRNIANQCTTAEVPFLFKQWGRWGPSPRSNYKGVWITDDGKARLHEPNDCTACYMSIQGKRGAGRKLDGKTWNEYPEF